jgi:hypothetical protein
MENNEDGTLTIFFTDKEAPIKDMGIKFTVKYEDYINFTLEQIFKLENEFLLGNIVEKCNKCRNQYDSDNCIDCTKENNFKNFREI